MNNYTEDFIRTQIRIWEEEANIAEEELREAEENCRMWYQRLDELKENEFLEGGE